MFLTSQLCNPFSHPQYDENLVLMLEDKQINSFFLVYSAFPLVLQPLGENGALNAPGLQVDTMHLRAIHTQTLHPFGAFHNISIED